MNHFNDSSPFNDPEPTDPGPGEWALDSSSLDANAAQESPSAPLGDLAQVMIVGRDGPWALVFVPLNRDLVWVDLERTPFRLQDYDPLAGGAGEDSTESHPGDSTPDPTLGGDWDAEGGWPLY